MNKPSAGDYFHMAYNVITPFLMLKVSLYNMVEVRAKEHDGNFKSDDVYNKRFS